MIIECAEKAHTKFCKRKIHPDKLTRLGPIFRKIPNHIAIFQNTNKEKEIPLLKRGNRKIMSIVSTTWNKMRRNTKLVTRKKVIIKVFTKSAFSEPIATKTKKTIRKLTPMISTETKLKVTNNPSNIRVLVFRGAKTPILICKKLKSIKFRNGISKET